MSVEDFLCFTVQQNGRYIRFSSSICWFFSCSEFERSTQAFFFNSFSSISVSWNEKIFPLFSFRIKMSEWRKSASFCFVSLGKETLVVFNRFLCERFCHWIVVENRCIERFVFCLNKVEQIFGIKREKLSLGDFPLSINSSPISIKYRRISLYSSWRHDRVTNHRLVSCLVFHLKTTIVFSQREFVKETNIFSFVDLLLSIEPTKMKSVKERRDFHLRSLIYEQICQRAELSRRINSLREKITSMRRSLNRSKIFSLYQRKQNSFLLDKKIVEIIRCSTSIKSVESQSVVCFYSLNKMQDLFFEKSCKIKKNHWSLNKISPLLIRRKTSEAEIKKNLHSVTVFKARCSSIIHDLTFRRFRSMSWFISFINLFPIWSFHRFNSLSVYVKKSISVSCVEEEKIWLTVLFRSAADKCSAPLSPIWFKLRLNLVSVCVKKSICVSCVEEEKIRLTVLFRSAADKCSAPLSPIWFTPRSSVLSVCVKKSICVFCVEEEKVRFTVLFRSAEDKCSAPLSPIWFL